MHEFSADEARRWVVWQRANALSAGRSDLICRGFAVITLAVTLIALVVALWRR